VRQANAIFNFTDFLIAPETANKRAMPAVARMVMRGNET
jgi:hypothetical protein